MKRGQWLPYFLAGEALIVILAWLIFGGVVGVVLAVLMGLAVIVGQIPISPRRRRERS